jgi:uncharacterized membrane protein YphA (DoxX/SURF4 family)
MRDIRRVSLIAVVLVVLLRLAIGWHLLYEGLWKYDQLDTVRPWSAEGYLRNAQGPFRDYFRGMTGDPDDLKWLDYEWVSQRWDIWRDRFIEHYGLTEEQQKELDLLLDGPKLVGERLSALPEDVELPSVVKYDSARKILYADADTPIEPDQVGTTLASVPEEGRVNEEFRKTFQSLAEKSQDLSYRRQLKAMMLGDPERVGATAFQRDNSIVYEPRMGTVLDPEEETVLLKYGDVQKYRDMLARYEKKLAAADTDYEHEHLAKEWEQIQQLRVKLVQPVINLEQKLLTDAWSMLTPEQLAKGRLQYDDSPIHGINRMTMWSLMFLGTLLIIGLFTPLAALAAAVMVFMFYLPVPPWPGVPQPPGPEHAFIVNKNLIESMALLAIATLPTGRWFGVDAFIARLFGASTGTKVDD